MKPPAPVTTTRSFFDMTEGLSIHSEEYLTVFSTACEFAALQRGISRARAARLLASRPSVKTPWCHTEIFAGKDGGKPVVRSKKLTYTSHIAHSGRVLANITPVILTD